MLRLLRIILLTVSVSVLFGCLPRQQYSYQPPDGKLPQKCVALCKQASNSCMQICALKNSTCRREMQRNAHERHLNYKISRREQGMPVRKTYDDFLRTSSCEHSCHCIPAYNTCYRACGGSVY